MDASRKEGRRGTGSAADYQQNPAKTTAHITSIRSLLRNAL
jgi:hypothetical protein